MANEFRFIRVDSFLDDINREDCFDTQDMDGVSPNFRFILASECASDITNCLDEDGTLINPYDSDTQMGVNILDIPESDGLCSMLWGKGVNGERTMSVSDSVVTFDIGEDRVPIKAMFLVAINNGTGYVIAYCIFDKTIYVDGTLILPVDGLVWGIRYG